MCNEIENDIRGKGYKIVMKKIKPKPFTIPEELKFRVIEILFPKRASNNWIQDSKIDSENKVKFTVKELNDASNEA